MEEQQQGHVWLTDSPNLRLQPQLHTFMFVFDPIFVSGRLMSSFHNFRSHIAKHYILLGASFNRAHSNMSSQLKVL